MRAKQLLGGAKPRLKSKSKNLIRIAQEEVKQGLVEYEIVQDAREEMEEISDSSDSIFIGEEITPEAKKMPVKKEAKKKEACKE